MVVVNVVELNSCRRVHHHPEEPVAFAVPAAVALLVQPPVVPAKKLIIIIINFFFLKVTLKLKAYAGNGIFNFEMRAINYICIL